MKRSALLLLWFFILTATCVTPTMNLLVASGECVFRCTNPATRDRAVSILSELVMKVGDPVWASVKICKKQFHQHVNFL